MAPVISLHSPVRGYTASIASEIYDESASEHEPIAVAVQPRRKLQNQIQLLERKARLTSIRSSTLSAVPSVLSQEPGPTLPTTPASREIFPVLRSKPSSVLLGEENVERSQLGTSSQSKTLRGQESSSTLHSFYESQKLPLIVSQQTSDSSSRDFALRKDCPVVVTPEVHRKHFFANSKSRAKSNEKKQRKERLDLSMLFPKPGTGNTPETKRTENPPYCKMHVKRPKAGTKHWFDSYDDGASDEEKSMTNFEPEMQPEFAEGLGEVFTSFSSDNSPISKQPLRLLTPPQSVSRTPEVSKSSRILGIEAPFPSRQTQLQPMRRQRAPSIPTPRSTPKLVPANPPYTANWKEQSILFLSSDDEDEGPTIRAAIALPSPKMMPTPLPRPVATSRPGSQLTGGLRRSLAVNTLDDINVEIGEARTVRSQPATEMSKAPKVDIPKSVSEPGRAARMRVVVPDRRSSKMASFFAEESPELHSSQSSGRPSGSPKPKSVHSRAAGAGVTRESLVSQPKDRWETALTEMAQEDDVSMTPSLQRRISTRLMPVTRQEQALLAAMRSKKATMRRRSVHQEDSLSWQEEMEGEPYYEDRPRTSTDTNTPAFVELGSNNYADWMNRRRSSLTAHPCHGTRASVTTFATTSQRASTRLSQYPTEESPGTPASIHNSALPRTSTDFDTRFSLSSSDYHCHSRSRTDSSHIVVLDDLNDSPKDVDLENGASRPRFPSWAYKSWSGSAGNTSTQVH